MSMSDRDKRRMSDDEPITLYDGERLLSEEHDRDDAGLTTEPVTGRRCERCGKVAPTIRYRLFQDTESATLVRSVLLCASCAEPVDELLNHPTVRKA